MTFTPSPITGRARPSSPRRYRIDVTDVTTSAAGFVFAPIHVTAGTVTGALHAAAMLPPSTWAGRAVDHPPAPTRASRRKAAS